MNILVIGTLGIIGSNLALRPLERGGHLVDIDNYHLNLKKARLSSRRRQSQLHPNPRGLGRPRRNQSSLRHHKRSFTYVDDIAEGVIRRMDRVPGRDSEWAGHAPAPGTAGVAPYRIFNIGNKQPVVLLRYIEVLEESLGKKAIMEMLPLKAGDVPDTEADVSALIENTGYMPVGSVEEGVGNSVKLYWESFGVLL